MAQAVPEIALQSLKVSELRKHALAAGVSAEDVDVALDKQDSKAALIISILKIHEIQANLAGEPDLISPADEKLSGVDDAWMRSFFASQEDEHVEAESLALPKQGTSSQLSSSADQYRTPTSLPKSLAPGGDHVSNQAGKLEGASFQSAEPEKNLEPPTTDHVESVHVDSVNTDGDHEDTGAAVSAEPAQVSLGGDLSGKLKSDEEIMGFLAHLQLVVAVPTVDEIRRARPLRRSPDEIYVAQFVLQAGRQRAQGYLFSEEAIREFHPHMQDGVFARLDDGREVIYQTNGVARTVELLYTRQVKCHKTGAPGVYTESRMSISRLREGKGRSGLGGAQSMQTAKQLKENLFYSFISCMLWFACTGEVGELGEEDTGERAFVRRSVRDFKQYWQHDFPIAKQLCLLIDHENSIMQRKFMYNSKDANSLALVQYSSTTIRSWQTYEFDGKAPKDDAAWLMISAARQGRTAELEKLVLVKGLDANVVLAEFGMFGAGGQPTTKTFTTCDIAYSIEGTALIEAIRLGWASVVECIINFAEQGLADLDVVCSEWSPHGTGGPGLRQHYTALDVARLYHRREIEALLIRANARSWTECPRHKRENPFHVRANQESGNFKSESGARNEDDFDDFSFANFDNIVMDDEMKAVTKKLEQEIKALSANMKDRERLFRKLALRWHPDKHPDEKKSQATRIFQWIQAYKDSLSWDAKAWSA